ncbi:MAG: hypothetical protein DRQ65_01800, partial [Gammaproteobacteria bacterium]
MTQQDSGQPLTIEPSAFAPLDSSAVKPPPRRNPRRWLLIGCALVFVLIMGFLLSAHSLQVVVTAENPAQVSVSGLVLPFGERYLLRRGEYEITASAEGYHTMVTSVTVGGQDSQTVELVLQPLPGLLSIESEPAGTRVLIDGEVAGATPLVDFPVAAGEHTLQLQAERYLPLEQALLVTGRNIQQQLQLQLAPAWAEVTLDSLPAGASILVDGEAVGSTPATVEILQGERQLILQLATYADWQQSLDLNAGEPLDLGRVELQPAAGMLEL